MAYSDNNTYRHIHFAVMAIESGARKLGISGKDQPKSVVCHNRF